jgi:hypothetical protein
MNHRSQRPRFRDTSLWKRIVERHKFRGRLLPTRVPLVFLRLGQPRELRQPRVRSQRSGPPVQLNLYFQLSWPQWLVTRHEPRTAFQTSTFNSTAIRESHWLRSNPKIRHTSETSKTITHLVAAAILRNNEEIEPRPATSPAAPKLSLETVRRDDRTRSVPVAEPRVASEDRPASLPSERGFRKAATVFQSTVTSINNRFRTVSLARNVFAPRGHSAVSLSKKVQPMAPAGNAHESKTTVVRRSLRHDTVERASRTTVETKSVSSLNVQSQLVHGTQTDDSRPRPARSRLYTQPAPLTFANQTPAASAARTQSNEQQSPAPARTPPPVVQPVQQQLDMDRLSDEVYRHIQRKIRIERERRGL